MVWIPLFLSFSDHTPAFELGFPKKENKVDRLVIWGVAREQYEMHVYKPTGG